MLLEHGEPKLEGESIGTQTVKVVYVGDVPVLRPRQEAGILERLGFVEVR